MSDPRAEPTAPPSQGTPPTTNAPKKLWGAGSAPSKEDWYKTVDLAGRRFGIRQIVEQSASKKPRYVFVLPNGKRFSADKTGSTIGDVIARDGLPPVGAGHVYTILKEDSANSPSGYSLRLVEVEGEPEAEFATPSTAAGGKA